MKIFAIDDETAILSELHQSIQEASPEAEIHDFKFAADALKAITENGLIPGTDWIWPSESSSLPLW